MSPNELSLHTVAAAAQPNAADQNGKRKMLGLRPWLRLLSFFPSRKIRAFTMDGVSASNHSFIMKMEQLVRARKIFGPLHTVLKSTRKVSFVIFHPKMMHV